MKALTLTQPWATLVAIGAKKIETRSWSTKYRGLLAIHAAIGGYKDDLFMMKIEPFYSALARSGIESRAQIPVGGIVAICELVQCFPIHFFQYGFCLEDHSKWVITHDERAFGDYTPGRYAWILENIQELPKPIRAKGKLGLWEWAEEFEVKS